MKHKKFGEVEVTATRLTEGFNWVVDVVCKDGSTHTLLLRPESDKPPVAHTPWLGEPWCLDLPSLLWSQKAPDPSPLYWEV